MANERASAVHSRTTPAWMDGIKYPALRDRLKATYLRIDKQVRANVDLEREKIAALEWCRANGNPHRQPPPEEPS